MSEPARHFPPQETPRASSPSGPLRDWLAAMRAAPADQPATEKASKPATPESGERATGWAPRLVGSAEAAEQDDEIAEIVAENLMLKAKLRLEAEHRDELQIFLAQEVRELRAHIAEEIAKLEDLRGERDLWKARCEALMQPLFRVGEGC